MSEITRLLPRHHAIIDRLLTGQTNREIAEALEVGQGLVSNVQKSPLVQAELARRREKLDRYTDEIAEVALSEARGEIERAALSAARVQAEALEDDNPSIRLKAADAVLNRALGRAEGGTSSFTQNNVVVLEGPAIENLQVALRESQELEV